jgi:hypothetical protein
MGFPSNLGQKQRSISKMSGGGGGAYLRGEFDRGEKDLRWSELEIAGGDGGNGERGRRRKKERRRKKKVFDRTVMP